MFELLWRHEKQWQASLAPGLYAFQPPVDSAHTHTVVSAIDAFLLANPESLTALPAPKSGEQILLPQHGGLVSNLRLWENIVLPHWYHTGRLGNTLEAQIQNWVQQLLPHIAEPSQWLHLTVGQTGEEERALAGFLRVLLSPAPWIWIEADWHFRLHAELRERCQALLLEHLADKQRIAFVFASDVQASHAMLSWSAAHVIDWKPI